MLSGFDAVVLAPCEFHLDPRHEYWANSLEDIGFKTLRMEVLESISNMHQARKIAYSQGVLTLASNRSAKDNDIPIHIRESIPHPQSVLGRFINLRLKNLLSAVAHDSFSEFRPRVVIANDLLGGILAQAIWGLSETAIIYDAQEIFTDSYDVIGGPRFTSSERAAWIDFESHICSKSNLVVTISPGVRDLYESRHGTACEVLPNFVPLNQHVNQEYEPEKMPKRFVLIGRADPNRGLEELVTCWDFPREIATLDLIMPFTQQRQKLVMLSSKVERVHSGPSFLQPVRPDEMIKVLSKYDVGILPYNYPYPYSHASPNKFGEYIAAGLALLANDQAFVSQLVTTYSLGRVFDWSKSGDFGNCVCALSNSSELKSTRDNVNSASNKFLNWEIAGVPVWSYLLGIDRSQISSTQSVDPIKQKGFQIVEASRGHEFARWYLRKAVLRLAKRFFLFTQKFRNR